MTVSRAISFLILVFLAVGCTKKSHMDGSVGVGNGRSGTEPSRVSYVSPHGFQFAHMSELTLEKDREEKNLVLHDRALIRNGEPVSSARFTVLKHGVDQEISKHGVSYRENLASLHAHVKMTEPGRQYHPTTLLGAAGFRFSESSPHGTLTRLAVLSHRLDVVLIELSISKEGTLRKSEVENVMSTLVFSGTPAEVRGVGLMELTMSPEGRNKLQIELRNPLETNAPLMARGVFERVAETDEDLDVSEFLQIEENDSSLLMEFEGSGDPSGWPGAPGGKIIYGVEFESSADSLPGEYRLQWLDLSLPTGGNVSLSLDPKTGNLLVVGGTLISTPSFKLRKFGKSPVNPLPLDVEFIPR